MRTVTLSVVGAVVAASVAGAAAALAPASGTIVLRATATYSDGTSADRLYEVTSDADSDGDGLNDSGWLRVACDGTTVSAVYHTVKSPRDSASGMASGKRTHKPFTIIKEWGPSTPMLGKTGAGGGGGGGVIGSRASWDLAKGKGARTAGTAAGYDVKKVEGTGARSGSAPADHSQASDASAGKGGGASDKTMAHDDWHQATLAAGSPNLCA